MGRLKILLEEEMPREKLIRFGAEYLTQVELLAILLRTGTKDKNVLDLSRDLLNKFSINQVSRKTYFELLNFKGIKQAKACQIIAAFEFARRASTFGDNAKMSLTSSDDVYLYAKADVENLNYERVICIFVDTKNQVIKKEIIHEGSLNYSIIEPRKIVKKILDYHASGFFLIHNHPSGDCTPSKQDIEVTKELFEVCLKLDIRFLDHVIIGVKHYSFFDNSLVFE